MSLPGLSKNAATPDITKATNQLAREYNRLDRMAPIIGTDTGTATAYAIAPIPGVVVYQVGQEFIFQATHANTGAAPTLAVNGLDAGAITYLDGSALAAGDIPLNGWVTVITTSLTPTFAMISCLSSSAFLKSLLTTRGDLLVRGSAAPQRLPLGTNGQVLTSNGTDAVWGAATTSSSVGLASGLKVTNDATTPSTKVDITAAAAVLVTSAGAPYLAKNISVVIDLTTGTATSTANGMDGEARGTTAGTPLYMYLIGNGSSVAGLCTKTSPLAGSPTMPSGYAYALYIGAMLIDGSGNLYRTIQYGKKTQYHVVAGSNVPSLPEMAFGAAGSFTPVSFAAIAVAPFVPPTAGLIKINIWCPTVNQTIMAAPNNSYGLSTSNPPFVASVGSGNAGPVDVADMILESANIYWASNSASGVISCIGWEDYAVAA